MEDSTMATSINSMSTLNEEWGICGFASSLSALYEHSPRQQAQLAQAAETKTRMLAEIKSYLVMLKADGRVDLLSAIQTFTRSFGSTWAAFDIDQYIGRINATVTAGTGDDFSIAMPPEAVVDYLRRMCDFKSARALASNLPDPPELILGLCSTTMRMHNGLAHWVYQLNGKIYSWGDEFLSVNQAAAAAGKTWTVGHKIALT